MRYGRQSGRARSRCRACGRQFVRRYVRQRPPPWVRQSYDAYSRGKHTYRELQRRTGRSPRTLRAAFDRWPLATGVLTVPDHPVALTVDGTFFGEDFGLLVCRAEGRNLAWIEIRLEDTRAYHALFDLLDAAGVQVASVTIDGSKGVRRMLQARYPGLPVQLCVYHQQRSLRTYLPPLKARAPAARAIRALAGTLPRTDRASFTAALDAWAATWAAELAAPQEGRRWGPLRRAYDSLRRNLPWLLTFRDHPELQIPPTTNSCEGSFGQWKLKVRLHRGIAPQRRRQLIDYLLEHG